MYSVEITVVLQARNGTMGLSRWVSLPFQPVEGLGLYGITTMPDRPETVARVTWDVLEESFCVELMDCESLEESLSELIDYYGPEWELHEPGFEPVQEP